jgi:hypothetical protein
VRLDLTLRKVTNSQAALEQRPHLNNAHEHGHGHEYEHGHEHVDVRRSAQKISGGDIEEATPEPIPNSEVKLFGADGTARVTVWESR